VTVWIVMKNGKVDAVFDAELLLKYIRRMPNVDGT
jgi:hypothetical protein